MGVESYVTGRVSEKTYPAISTAKLHKELVDAGLKVVTIRGDHAQRGEPARRCVIVLRDSTNVGSIPSVLSAHVPDGVVSRQPSAAEETKILSVLESKAVFVKESEDDLKRVMGIA